MYRLYLETPFSKANSQINSTHLVPPYYNCFIRFKNDLNLLITIYYLITTKDFN